jgi:hypothetical protein
MAATSAGINILATNSRKTGDAAVEPSRRGLVKKKPSRLRPDYNGIAALIRAVLFGIAAIITAWQANPFLAHFVKIIGR